MLLHLRGVIICWLVKEPPMPAAQSEETRLVPKKLGASGAQGPCRTASTSNQIIKWEDRISGEYWQTVVLIYL